MYIQVGFSIELRLFDVRLYLKTKKNKRKSLKSKSSITLFGISFVSTTEFS